MYGSKKSTKKKNKDSKCCFPKPSGYGGMKNSTYLRPQSK